MRLPLPPLSTALSALLLGLLPACAGGETASQPALPALSAAAGLPGLAELDALPTGPGPASGRTVLPARAVSGVQYIDLLPASPLLSQNVSPDGAYLQFEPTDSGLAWAIYRFDPPFEWSYPIIASGLQGPAGLWLLKADYQAGCWNLRGDFKSGETGVSIDPSWETSSPAGHYYLAVLCLANSSLPRSVLRKLYTFHYGDPPNPDYFVAPPVDGGDDANDGSAAHPWATLQHAADSVAAGDTVVVRPGQYAGFMLQRSGTPGQPITFSAELEAQITSRNPTTDDGINIENWGDGGPDSVHDIVIDGFTVSGIGRAGIRIVGSDTDPGHDIVIRNNACLDNGVWGILSGFVDDLTVEGNACQGSIEQHGIYLSNSGDGNIVRGNYCAGNHDCGIQLNADVSMGGDGTMSNAVIEYNTCANNGTGGGAAINLDGVADSLIRCNLLYDNHAGGIVIYNGDGQGSQNNRAINNTVVQAADGRWAMLVGSSPGNRLRNNILHSYHPTRGAITVTDPLGLNGLDSDYNIVIDRFSPDDSSVINLAQWRTQTGQDLHSAVSGIDEVFYNAGSNQYFLKPNSPAIDFGANDPDNPDFDWDGTARPLGAAIDAGAYEFAD